jgi:polyphosphate glucokinase
MTNNILAIDVGGSHLKASVLDAEGNMQAERVRIDTPVGAHPDDCVLALQQLVAPLPAYDRVAIGFPGMVRDGIVRTAPLLGHDAWRGYPLAENLGKALGKPCRLGNDADVQGFAVIAGKGLEMVLTLGTGFGSALYENGRLCPHLELAHAPFRKGQTYNEQVGEAARKQKGDGKWQQRVLMAIDNMRTLVQFDHLYLGGGNSRRLRCELPADVSIVDNDAGIRGGAWLWRD